VVSREIPNALISFALAPGSTFARLASLPWVAERSSSPGYLLGGIISLLGGNNSVSFSQEKDNGRVCSFLNMEIFSKYTSEESVQDFRKDVMLSGSGREGDVVISPVGSTELVTRVNTQAPHYFYMYASVVENLNLWLPFTDFELALLNALNVAPTQLHPNSWAFVKAFELVCLGLDLEPRLGVFFHFYYIKSLFPGKQVSISSQPNRGLFSLYASNFKNYKDTFFRVSCGPCLPDLMYDAGGKPLFPFYWTPNPRLVKGVDEALLTPYESEVISFLDTFLLFEIKELLALETDHPSLVLYLRESLLSLSI
jgi:hypothetical protein